jgi:NADH pyrophosphatase NudC (nudix superfamily)
MAPMPPLEPLKPMEPLQPMEPMQLQMGDMRMSMGGTVNQESKHQESTPEPASQSAPGQQAKRFCTQCGQEAAAEDRFCGGCGHRLKDVES